MSRGEQTSLPVGETPLGDAFNAGYDAGRIDGWESGYRAGFQSGGDVGGHRVLLALQTGWPDLAPARRLISRQYRDLLDGPGVAAPCTCSCCQRARRVG